MTQEEDDLEEELRCLDIREDHGAEESDVTPTNTPPSSPPILYIKKYPPSQPVGYEENKDFGRYSRGDDNECRSDSSLSWGDDEFEGEATRQVSALFDQLDSLLYQDDSVTSAVPWSVSGSTKVCVNEDEKTVSPAGSIGYFSSPESNPDEHIETNIKTINKDTIFNVDNVGSQTLLLNSARLLESSSGLGSDLLVAPEPTPELLEECSNWVHHFPHFRIRGRVLETSLLNIIEQYMNEDSLNEETLENEEVIEEDGHFHHLLPIVNIVSANQVKNSSHVNPKTGTSSSRVCSGSNDPEVLKEQVLIMLFDHLWPTVTKAIEPLLHSYAKYVIEQSVQYSSLSREPSTRGARRGRQTPVRKYSADLGRATQRHLKLPESVNRPDSGISVRGYRANRPLSGIQRPSSAINRLQGFQPTPSIHQGELQELLQVTTKPLQNGEDRLRSRISSASHTRESSARSSLSLVSLPSVTTPRGTTQRPVSSRAAHHLLTPMRIDSFSTTLEQRPSSTSSYNARSRFQEKFHHLSRQGTIQEMSSNVSAVEIEEEPQDFPSPTWSRHISFLPPIADNSSSNLPKVYSGPSLSRQNSSSRRSASGERSYQPSGHDTQQSQVMPGEESQLSSLTVRGTTLSAAHRPHAHTKPKRHTWGTPIIDGSRNRRLINSNQK